MKQFRNGGVLSEAEFMKIKLLLDARLKTKQIREVTGWSETLIKRVEQNETYPAYREEIKNVNQYKPNKDTAEAPLFGEPQLATRADLGQTELVQVLYKINENLTRLVAAWEARPTGGNTIQGERKEKSEGVLNSAKKALFRI